MPPCADRMQNEESEPLNPGSVCSSPSSISKTRDSKSLERKHESAEYGPTWYTLSLAEIG